MRRREFIAVLGGAAAAIPLAPTAAQRRAVRIGWLVFGGATTISPDFLLRADEVIE
ncbi:MAG: hypothetical protein ACJ8DS_22935 [Microvirga sp.]